MVPTNEQDDFESPRALAERLFGAAAHTILLSDHGPSAVFMGWRLGIGRAQAEEGGGVTRVVDVEIYVDEDERYAIAERSAYAGADGQAALDATVTLLDSPEQVREYCDAASFQPMRDAALCAALDHVAKYWPHLGRRRKRRTTPQFLRAALSPEKRQA